MRVMKNFWLMVYITTKKLSQEKHILSTGETSLYKLFTDLSTLSTALCAQNICFVKNLFNFDGKYIDILTVWDNIINYTFWKGAVDCA